MKRLAILLLTIFSIMTLLVPGMAFAQIKTNLTTEEQDVIDNQTGVNENKDELAEIFKAGGLCLTNADKTNYISTVLETPIDSPEDIIVYDKGEDVPNGDGTKTRRCFRFTRILKLQASGSDKQQITDQYLIKQCPSEDTYQDGYGLQTTPTNPKVGNYYDCQEVTVIMSPLEQGGVGVLNVYVSLIYRWVAGIVGVIAVLIMIVSGIQIITAQGESEAITEGKKRILQSLGGIVLLFFATGLLYMINPTFFNPPEYPTAATTPSTAPATTPKEMTTPPPTPSEIPGGSSQQAAKFDATPMAQ